MSNEDKMTPFEWVIAGLLILGVLIIIGSVIFGMVKAVEHKNMVERVDPICKYLHAERHGNVCIKGNEVVYNDDKR